MQTTLSDGLRTLLELKTRTDFVTFLHRVFQTVCPGQRYLHNWHIDALAYRLDRCVNGDVKRLLITMPPRYLKSICVSVALPAWILGHDPKRRIVCVSYSLELASKFALDCRAVMESAWYRRAFPGTAISRERSREMDFMTTKRGGRLATSVGGTLTGRGGNVFCLDDLIKPSDAYSDTVRASVNDWVDGTLYTRLDDKIQDIIIAVMQRLHVDDPAGHILSKGGEWDHLNLPVIADVDEMIPIGRDEMYHRRAGELLHEAREPQRILDGLRRDLGSFRFSAQYQQCPVPPEGAVVKREWFRIYDELPQPGRDDMTVQSWDTGLTTGENSDYSACTTWRVRDKHYYLLDVMREKLGFPDLKKTVINQANQFGATVVVIENKGSGMSLVQQLQSDETVAFDVMGYTPEGDKLTRMHAQSARIEGGHVFVPRQALWLEEFFRELLQFPHGAHDDQVDSLSQFLHWAQTHCESFIGVIGRF